MDLSRFNKELEFVDFCKINKNLNNFQRYSVSAVVNNMPQSGLDQESYYFSIIRSEIMQHIYKIILQDLFKTKNVDFFDARPFGDVDNYKCVSKLTDFVMLNGAFYKNLVTNGHIMAALQDSNHYFFQPTSNNIVNSSGHVYPIGKFSNLSLYVDPYMRWSDDMMCIFDDVEINIENLNARVESEATFALRLVVDYHMDYYINQSKLLYVVQDGNRHSNAYNEYLIKTRDEKIDSVIGEGKTENPLI